MDRSLVERVSEMEERLDKIEQFLGMNITDKKGKKKKTVEKEESEETISGFTKSQLRTMFQWAKGTKLQLLSRNDFEELKRWEMLREFYPEAPENYDDIKL